MVFMGWWLESMVVPNNICAVGESQSKDNKICKVVVHYILGFFTLGTRTFPTRTLFSLGIDASLVKVGFFFVPTILIMLEGGLLAAAKPTRISGVANFKDALKSLLACAVALTGVGFAGALDLFTSAGFFLL
jgi:hypothetical protein